MESNKKVAMLHLKKQYERKDWLKEVIQNSDLNVSVGL